MAKRANGDKVDVAEEVARLVGAGKTAKLPTVDFSDPKRPKTCLEVDFPILPVNQVATIEGNAGKPIYQMSKWWARRRSSVFRAMLIAAATKAPDDPAHAAKLVWDSYYHNHQKGGTFKNLKVADIFMGGGTTVIEGSRLGMQMFGCDLNPVAWFVVKNELAAAKVKREEVEALLADIEAEVKPQIMPFYACDCPRGHKGKWIKVATDEEMQVGFDPLRLTPEERKAYRYEGPEIIYVFWAKHGPCSVTKCGHRTPLISTPVMSVKELSISYWPHKCHSCKKSYDIEDGDARMAPDVPLVVADDEKLFAVLNKEYEVKCPHCGHEETCALLGKGQSKKVSLTLLVHPQWLGGCPAKGTNGKTFGGSADDAVEATIEWYQARARKLQFIEYRGNLPAEIVLPNAGKSFKTGNDGGTIPKKSAFSCNACGKVSDILETARHYKKDLPFAPMLIQGFCPQCARGGTPYNGRFFRPVGDTKIFEMAVREWDQRKNSDLVACWPKSEVPPGMEADFWGVRDHGFTHFWKMFNPRQLLVHSLILKSLLAADAQSTNCMSVDLIAGVFQQYLRNQCMFTLWNPQRDTLEPHFSKNNFRPKTLTIENCTFSDLGRGNWRSCAESVYETISWALNPYELVPKVVVSAEDSELAALIKPVSVKTACGDPLLPQQTVNCQSATELRDTASDSVDIAITDPPFGELIQYAELADYFYVWLRLLLNGRYPNQFSQEYSPKTLEAVSNKSRHPDNPNAFWRRLLTECWQETYRILKPGGLLAFTFHHREDDPWYDVLESLFEAGFYLEATYPIRSDETKGSGEFGAQNEYDIIHVCRKRTEEPEAVSWARMRRQVMNDVSALASLLRHHEKEGLLSADLQMIKRGKALEYYSRHYGKVFVDENRPLSVKAALLGINQVIEEDPNDKREASPANAEPQTRQFLRLFYESSAVEKDQMSKALRGTGITPDEFVANGWCRLEKKIYRLVPPLEIAQTWEGRHRRLFTSDYEQAMFLIGACVEGSGLNAKDTLNNENFRPHPALKGLLNWLIKHGAGEPLRRAAGRALTIYLGWERENADKAKKGWLFEIEEEA